MEMVDSVQADMQQYIRQIEPVSPRSATLASAFGCRSHPGAAFRHHVVTEAFTAPLRRRQSTSHPADVLQQLGVCDLFGRSTDGLAAERVQLAAALEAIYDHAKAALRELLPSTDVRRQPMPPPPCRPLELRSTSGRPSVRWTTHHRCCGLRSRQSGRRSRRTTRSGRRLAR